MADDRKLSPFLVAAVLLVSCSVQALAWGLVVHSRLRYFADAGYFIEQLAAHADYGRALYTGLEFAYGPLLFYPTLWLHALLRSSWTTAYFATLLLETSVGLLLLAFVLNSLPILPRDRRLGLLLLAAGSLTPLLGLNYTFFRFLSPFAALLFATRSASLLKTAVLLTTLELLLLGISPEIGLAFLIGSLCFAVLRAIQPPQQSPPGSTSPGQSRRRNLAWLLAGILPILAALLALATAGRPYLRMLASFSHGALNLPVAPYPHLLIFLFATVWLVPSRLGSTLRRNAPHALQTVSCYALGLALLPAALGRCDPLHVFFNGAGLLILSLVALRTASRPTRIAWIAALLLLVGWEQAVSNGLYAERTADTLRLTLMPRLPRRGHLLYAAVARFNPHIADHLRPTPNVEYHLDVPALERIVGSSPVATPLEVSPAVEDALKRSHHYRSDFFAFFGDVMNLSSEQHKIHDLNQARWALLPADPEDPLVETPRTIDGVQGFAFPYPLRHPIPFHSGQAFDDNLDDNWVELQHFGPYVLYRNALPNAARTGQPDSAKSTTWQPAE